MKALITGIFGMDARNLAELLLERNYEVVGTYRYSSVPLENRLEDKPPFFSKIKLACTDLADASGVNRLISKEKPDLVFNLAAQSHVGQSFIDPAQTFNVDAMGLLNVLEAIRLFSPKTKTYHACHDIKTKALTIEGEKSFDEIKVGDYVVTLNEETNKPEFKRVKKVHIYDYNDNLIRIKSRRINQFVTPNHKVLLQGNKVNAEDLFNIERAHLPLCDQKEGLDDKYINLKDLINKDYSNHYKNMIWQMETKDLLYLLGIFIGDGWIKNVWRNVAENRQFFRNNLGQFTTTKNKLAYRKITSSYIEIAVPETDPARIKILNILNKYNIEYKTNYIMINFSSFTLSEIFRLCGDKSYNKIIPDFCWKYSGNLLKFLLSGIIDSDGCLNKKKGSVSTTSKILCTQLSILATLCRYTSTSTINNNVGVIKKLKNGRDIIKRRPSYNVHLNIEPKPILLKPDHLSREHYSGKVWCLEVEDNHNFLISRDGKIAFSGNSTSEMFGKQFELQNGKPIQTINTPLIPSSPYGVAKLSAHHLVRVYREGYGLYAVSGILFNHTDVFRTPTFFERKVSKYVASLEKGYNKPLPLGVIEGVYRDIGWSKDYMRAAILMLEQENPQDFVVATGETHPITEILDIAFSQLNLDYRRYIYIDPELVRPVDVPYLCGDSTPIRELGWSPTKTFTELINMLVSHDRGITHYNEYSN